MAKSRPKKADDRMWNTLTTVMLSLTVLALIVFFVLFLSPTETKEEAALAQLIPTSTPRPTIAVTDTPSAVPPTWTIPPSPTRYPTNTSVARRATNTPKPTVLFTRPPTRTPTPSPTIHPWPFQLSEEDVQYMPYFLNSTCDWLGIGGEVLDQQGEHVLGIAVVLNGGGLQNIVTMSGDKSEYAPSGWEHFVDNKVKEGDFTIQLWHKGQPVSELVNVRTRADCRANLAYLTFRIVWEDWTP